MKPLSLSAIVLALAHAVVGTAQVPFVSAVPILSPDLKVKIGEMLSDAGIVSYSMGVFRLLGEEAHEEYAQWGQRTELGEPMTENTIQAIGSLSKAFTAAALGILMDDFANGRNATSLPPDVSEFTWDTKVAQLLPEHWELMDEWTTQKLSIRDALSHMSGLPTHDLAYFRDDTTLDVIKRMRHLRPSWELREHWEYNNQPYLVAQHLTERYSGQSIDSFVTKRIFAPLKMHSSTYSSVWANSTGHLSEAHAPSGRRIPTWFNDEDTPFIGGAGNILSSAPDLIKWAKALLGVTRSDTVGIPCAVLEECLSAQSLVDKHGRSTYGFGWAQATKANLELIFHAGGLPGASTRITLIPSLKAAIVQLASSNEKHDTNIKIVSEILMTLNPTTNVSDAVQQSLPVLAVHDDRMSAARSLNFTAPLNKYAGTYHNAAYGDIIVCPVTDLDPHSRCAAVHSDYTAIGVHPGPTLFAYFRRQNAWAKYMNISPSGHQPTKFKVELTTIFPKGFGMDTSPFEIVAHDWLVSGEWQIAADGSVQGFGMYDLPEYQSRRHHLGATVEDQAQVWFDKV